MDRKRASHQALVDSVLNGAGAASAEDRARAFGNGGFSPPLSTLIDKVRTGPTRITDADFAVVKDSGLGEDEIFELVVCAAVGQSARMYEAGLAALAEAADGGSAGGGDDGHAT